MRAAPRDWMERERGLAFATEEAGRYLRRARGRLVWLLILGMLVSGAYVVRRALAKTIHVGTVVFRIAESNRELTDTVKPSSHYSTLIKDNYLSGPRLRAIIEKFKLYPANYAKDPQLAIEEMRRDLEVIVWGDYFDETYYAYDDEARTARVSIAWTSKDPELTMQVTRAIGASIVAAQAEDRRQAFRLAQQDVAVSVEEARLRLDKVQREMAQQKFLIEHGPKAGVTKAKIAWAALKPEMVHLEQRLTDLSNARTRFEITAARERQQSGIQFEILEPGVVQAELQAGPIAVGITAVALVGLVVLLGSLLAGAFEVRVRSVGDAQRIGLPVLGSVPPFRGDAVGALAERLRTADRLGLRGR